MTHADRSNMSNLTDNYLQEARVHTAVTEMFDIRYPIFAFSHTPAVVAAVSRAGGLGVLGATSYTAEELAADLQWINERADGRPFGLDLMIPSKHASSTAELEAAVPEGHRTFVRELLADHGVASDEIAIESDAFTAGMLDPERHAAELLKVAFDFPIQLVASALGPPYPDMVASARHHDVKVAALAGSIKHARRNVDAGADLIVAQGTEAGAHTGDVTTMVLVPEIVDAVAPVPVAAAGGIGRGRQMAAALSLGAQAVWCGSVWLTTKESDLEPLAKDLILAAGSDDTVRSTSRTGKPARQIRSDWTEAWDSDGAPQTLPMPLQRLISEPAMNRCFDEAARGNPGARQLINDFVGQIAGLLNDEKSVAEVITTMVEEAALSGQVVDRMFGADAAAPASNGDGG